MSQSDGEKNGVLEELRPILVLSELEANALQNEFVTLFEHLLQGTKFATAKIVMAGSLREKLKVGVFDEADIQLRFDGQRGNPVKDSDNCTYIIAGVEWKRRDLFVELSRTLQKNLAKISWKGIYLRPISIRGPWMFIREGNSSQRGVTVSVDVVPLFMYGGNTEKEHMYQGEILEGAPSHQRMFFSTLETWDCNRSFYVSFFAYEWDMIDSLPICYRLAIVMGKSLLQAYDSTRIDSHQVNMPITSYTIKTALFFILAYNCSQLNFEGKFRSMVVKVDAFRNAIASIEGYRSPLEARASKLKFASRQKSEWTTDDDLDQYGEEARVLVLRIFQLIKCLAEQGWKLTSYWHRFGPVAETKGFGEAEYICDICDCALECLNPTTFYNNQGCSSDG